MGRKMRVSTSEYHAMMHYLKNIIFLRSLNFDFLNACILRKITLKVCILIVKIMIIIIIL